MCLKVGCSIKRNASIVQDILEFIHLQRRFSYTIYSLSLSYQCIAKNNDDDESQNIQMCFEFIHWHKILPF